MLNFRKWYDRVMERGVVKIEPPVLNPSVDEVNKQVPPAWQSRLDVSSGVEQLYPKPRDHAKVIKEDIKRRAAAQLAAEVKRQVEEEEEERWRRTHQQINDNAVAFEEECKDGDKISAAFGLNRSEGGRLRVQSILNAIVELRKPSSLDWPKEPSDKVVMAGDACCPITGTNGIRQAYRAMRAAHMKEMK